MNYFLRFFITLFILMGTSISVAYEVDASSKGSAEVKLTAEQQQELAEIYKNMFAKKKEVIKKYVEFGVLTEEKGMKIKQKIDAKYEKLKDNGFIFQKEQCKKHKEKSS